MKTLSAALLGLALAGAMLQAEEETSLGKKAAPLEKICVAVEPAVMKTEASQPMPGATQTVLSPAMETREGMRLLSKEEFEATHLSWDEFLTKSKEAAARLLATLKPEITKDKEGNAREARIISDSHLTASIMLCPEFYQQFSLLFQSDIVVVVPNRSTLLIFPRSFGDFRARGEEIAGIFANSTYPASSEAFEITAEGIKSLGSFSTENEEESFVPTPP